MAEYFYGLPVAHEFAIYDSSGLITSKLGQLSTRKFMVIHGTADASVHVQNTMLLTKSLIEYSRIKNQKETHYSSLLYPDEDHEFSNSKKHLYTTISEYVSHCFNGVKKE